MARRPSSTPASVDDRPVYDHLDAAERVQVLTALIEEQAPLLADAECHAHALLAGASIEAVADEVTDALEDIPLEDLASRAGRQPGLGYVHEGEAAMWLVEEAVEPFVDDLRRRASLGMHEAAIRITLGVLTGLYRCQDAVDGSVLAYAGPDTPGELAHWVQREASEAGLALPSEDVAIAYPDEAATG
jgi:hypothetical protein